MPSPFGKKRSASMYYQHGGLPHHYAVNWDGLPPGSTRAAETTSLGGSGDYIDIRAAFHRTLDGIDYPVSMSAESGRRSVLHSGPEQTHTAMGFFGNLSDNEKKLAVLAAVGVAGWFFWKRRR